MDIIKTIAEETSIKTENIQAIINLYEEGSTISFMTKYRQEKTGLSNDFLVKKILTRHQELKTLQKKKKEISETFSKQSELTKDLETKILKSKSISELDEISQIYQIKTKTPAITLLKASVKQLVEKICKQEPLGESLESLAHNHINESSGLKTAEQVIDGIRKIVKEELLRHYGFWTELKNLYWQESTIKTTKTEDSKQTKNKEFEDFSKSIRELSNQQFLSIQAGMRQKQWQAQICIDDQVFLEKLFKKNIKTEEPALRFLLESIMTEIYHEHFKKTSDSLMLKRLWKTAEENLIETSASNLQNLLLQPAWGKKPLCVIDFNQDKNSLFVCFINRNGACIENILLALDNENKQTSTETLCQLVSKHQPEAIFLPNKEGACNIRTTIKETLQINNITLPLSLIDTSIPELCSKSKEAQKEFAEVQLRFCVTLGRYVMDPLFELIKSDPIALPLCANQRTINRDKLTQELRFIIESNINKLGADLNFASEAVLKYISGLDERLAKEIVSHREKNGPFKTKADLLQVKGITPKHYVLTCGFIRVHNAENPLDATAIHPERYELVDTMATALGKSIPELFQTPDSFRDLVIKDFEKGDVGLETIRQIMTEFRSPAKDPRSEYEILEPCEGIYTLTDLRRGLLLKGRVINVATFGAFVDIGLPQLALLHKSSLTESRGSVPLPTIKLGRVLSLQITDVDKERKRIQVDFPSQRKPKEHSTPRHQKQHGKPHSGKFGHRKDKRRGPPKSQLGTLGDQFANLFKNN